MAKTRAKKSVTNKRLVTLSLLLILLAVIALAAFGLGLLGAGGAAAGGPSGTISGVVLLGPTCPVMRNPPEPQCADRPYKTSLELTTADQSRVIEEFASSAEGTFSIIVPAGAYAIRPASSQSMLPRCAATGTFVVPANGSAEVTVYCDTGIR